MIWDIVAKVMVNEQKDVEPLTVTENGTYSEEGKAYSPVTVNVPTAVMDTLNVTENGTYTPQSGHAYNEVNVNVQSGGGESKLAKVVSDTENYQLSAQDLAGVTTIRNYAFYGVTKLTSIEIPSGVTSISPYTFYRCSGLKSVEIPSGVTSIGSEAFSQCGKLTSIEIPSSVTSIGNRAFYQCFELKSAKLPSGITSIPDSMFESCMRLESIEIPSSVTSIGNKSFAGLNHITSIEIPSGVTSIGSMAFLACSSLKIVILKSITPPSLYSVNVFENTHADLAIYVPDESVSAYQSAKNWSTYASKIKPLSEYTPS